MRKSTLVILLGVALFLLPVPGTFVLGGLLAVLGAIARVFGF